MPYGEKENALVCALGRIDPDFAAAQKLLAQGADINAYDDFDENVLSDIIVSFGHETTFDPDKPDTPYDDPQEELPIAEVTERLCAVIRFCLDHGFDVSRREGQYGAICLHNLVLAVDAQAAIAATKLLLDAGAKNVNAYSEPESDPWDSAYSEASFQLFEGYPEQANDLFALCKIYHALDKKLPYRGIDSCKTAIGKKILRVLLDPEGEKKALRRPNSHFEPYVFHGTLYLICEDLFLLINAYEESWVDTSFSDGDLIDVSRHFYGMIGSTIEGFSFDDYVYTVKLSGGWTLTYIYEKNLGRNATHCGRFRLYQERRRVFPTDAQG